MPTLVPVLEVVGIGRYIVQDTALQDVIVLSHLDRVLTELQVDLILIVVPLVGKLEIGEGTQLTRSFAVIGHFHEPELEVSSQGYVVRGLTLNIRVTARDARISRAVTALTGVRVQGFTHRLPARRPIVPALIVAEIDVTPGLVHRNVVETQPREATLCRGLVDAVASRVVGRDGPILGRAQVVGPGARSIGTFDDVLAVDIVEVSVAHGFFDGEAPKHWPAYGA